jgi:hypothetical protein
MKDLSKYNVAFTICPELKEHIYFGFDFETDTTQLQIASLLVFASSVGFEMQPDFSFKLWDKHFKRSYSFEYVVSLHNNGIPASTTKYRLVKKVKLQRHKRAKKLIAQSMMVELV